MQKNTHIVGGLCAGSLIVVAGASGLNKLPLIEFTTSIPSTLAYAGIFTASVFGSLYPDIDHPGSYLGRRLVISSSIFVLLRKIAAKLKLKNMQNWFAHRGIMHSCITWIFNFFLLGFIINIFKDKISLLVFQMLILMQCSFVAGALSHIALDYCNKGGVPILLPFMNKKFRNPFTKIITGSVQEHIFKIVLTALLLIFIVINVMNQNFIF